WISPGGGLTRRWLAALLSGILCAAAAFGYVEWRSPRSSDERVSGVIVDVESHQIVYADSLTLRTADGRQFTFVVEPSVATNADHPNTASHLRQHMMFGDPVTVEYRSAQDELEATS